MLARRATTGWAGARIRRHGTAAVEFAFCMPLLLTIMAGLWEVGRIIEVQQVMWNSAREAARDASLGQSNLTTVANNLLTYLQSAEPTAFGHAKKFTNLMRWFERIDAMGAGDVRPMDPDEALKIARESTPATRENIDDSDPNELKAGTRVSVTPDDYGFDPVTGRVVVSTIHEIAIEREDPELGKIVNHFPKIGFRIAAA